MQRRNNGRKNANGKNNGQQPGKAIGGGVISQEKEEQEIDVSIAGARFDISPTGDITQENHRNRKPGVRQKRFTFDAPVIRDTLVMKLRSVGADELADGIDACHRSKVYKQCSGCKVTKTFFNRCERFYCPICAGRLARDRRETVEWWSTVVSQPKHVVLTVLSVPVLSREFVRKLKDDFRKLRSMKWAKEGEFLHRATAIRPATPNAEPLPGKHRRRNRLSPWKGRQLGRKTTRWRGGFGSIDVTHTANGWHVHLHVIVDADFIDVQKLDEAWAKLRGQQFAIVRVYDVRGKAYTNEVTKYVSDGVQMGNWPAEKLGEFCRALTGEKLFFVFGALYKQRAEWSAFKETIHEDRDVCECGCTQFKFLDENEWEWQMLKSTLAPPRISPVDLMPASPLVFNL